MDIQLPLGRPYGGPLFFAHYSFLGINPHGLNRCLCKLLDTKHQSFTDQLQLLQSKSKRIILVIVIPSGDLPQVIFPMDTLQVHQQMMLV